jgi:uncharacterized delta-60 repeat protein
LALSIASLIVSESLSAPAVRYASTPSLSVLLLALFTAPSAFAQAGSLDPTFDGDGKAATAFGSGEAARAVAVQADGRILAAGYTGAAGGFDALDFALARYHADGRLDLTFDGDGRVTTAFSSNADAIHAAAMQDDGRIVVAGESNGDFALARYHTDGRLDTSFDGDGRVTTAFGSAGDYARAVAVQADGRIVAAGYTWNGSRYTFAVARYDADGSLDTRFDADGKVTTAFGTDDARAFALALQADGRIIVAGSAGITGDHYDFAVARYDADGHLDPSFDGDGRVTTSFAAFDFGYALALQADGRLVVAGETNNGTGTHSDFALARYDADGSLDTRFDADGKVTTAFSSNNAVVMALGVQADGRLLAAGTAVSGGTLDFALARYEDDGRLDAGFDADGKVTTAFGTGTDGALALALHEDGRAVAAGYTHNGSDEDFALARYFSDADLAVSAVPLNPPVVVPAGGGRFRLSVTLANGTGQPRDVAVWTEAVGPATLSPALGPRSVSLDPFEVRTVTLTQPVPGTVPPGDYVYTVQVAAGFDLSVTTASFPAEKAPGSQVRQAGVRTARGAAGTTAPDALSLSGPAPHPFHRAARLTLSVPTARPVRVALYDALGREAAVLLDGTVEAGMHVLTLGGSALPAGTYVVRAASKGEWVARTVVRY